MAKGKKTGGGSRRGRKNRVPPQLRKLAKECDWVELVRVAVEKALDGDMTAWRLLAEYGYGRPHQTVEVDSTSRVSLTVDEIRKMPDDILRQIITAGSVEEVLAGSRN